MATFRPDEENSVYIGEGAELTGAIRARDAIVIDGAFDGDIVGNHLLVGPTGVVKGRISVLTADISGVVSAELAVKALLSVRATGRVEGSWDCGAIEVARGGTLNGSAQVTETANGQGRETRALTTAEKIAPLVVEADLYEASPAEVTPLHEPRRLPKLSPRAAARRQIG
jgi:cytoskeletal protein CcmA (bactofilin family)